jgi:hypothetical protein
LERAIAFALFISEGLIDVPEPPPRQLDCLQHSARPPLAVIYDPSLAGLDALVALARCPAGRGLLPISTSSTNSSASAGLSPNAKLSKPTMIDPHRDGAKRCLRAVYGATFGAALVVASVRSARWVPVGQLQSTHCSHRNVSPGACHPNCSARAAWRRTQRPCPIQARRLSGRMPIRPHGSSAGG